MTKDKKKKPDWEAIWCDYRAGVLSVREVARVHSVDASYLLRKANKLGVKRDLTKRVKEAVNTKLVHGSVHTPGTSDDDIVEKESSRVVDVVMLHRKDIQDTREAVRILRDQLIESTLNITEIEEEIVKETEDDRGANRRNQMLKAVSLLSSSSIIGNLTNAISKLIPLERQAHNLNDEEDTEKKRIFVSRVKAGSDG